METLKKNINDYFTVKKRISNEKPSDLKGSDDLSKASTTSNFKTPANKKTLTRNCSSLKKSAKLNGHLDIREAFLKAKNKAVEEANFDTNELEKLKTPKRKEISPVLAETRSLSDSKKFKSMKKSDLFKFENVDNREIIRKGKIVRKKIFNDNDEVTAEVDHIIDETSFPLKPISPLPKSPIELEEIKISPNDMRSKLANCSKLSELREKLLTIKNLQNKLEEFQKVTSSPVKINLSPCSSSSLKAISHGIRSPRKLLEAHQEKHASKEELKLEEDISFNTHSSLTLPDKFHTLLEFFTSLDTVISMLHNRKEACFFDKIKSSIQKMLRRRFDINKLSTIATIYPDAYSYHYDSGSLSGTQLVLTPNIDSVKMTPAHLLKRKEHFASLLLEIVKSHHSKFLATLDGFIKVDNNLLRRWHPRFKLNDIPDIENNPDALPSPPYVKESKTSVEKFLQQPEEKVIVNLELKEENTSIKNDEKILSGVLKGVSKALLDKVRAKEAEAIKRQLTRTPEIEQKIAMIKRLPTIMRIIHSYFIGEKKAARPMSELVEKCTQSYPTSISISDCQEQIDLLAKLLPDWLIILKVRNGVYVKIEKEKNLSEMFEKLEELIKKLKLN